METSQLLTLIVGRLAAATEDGTEPVGGRDQDLIDRIEVGVQERRDRKGLSEEEFGQRR